MKYIFSVLMGLSVLVSFSVEASVKDDKKESPEKIFSQKLREFEEPIVLRHFIKEAQEHGDNCVARYINGAEWQRKDNVFLVFMVKDYLGWTPSSSRYDQMIQSMKTLRVQKQREVEAKKKKEKEAADLQSQLATLRTQRHNKALGKSNAATHNNEQAAAPQNFGFLDWVDSLMR